MSSVSEIFEISLSKQQLKLFCETSKFAEMTHILLYEKKSINSLKSKTLCEIFASCTHFDSWHMNAQNLSFHDYYFSSNICVSNERNHFLQSWNNSLFFHNIFISVFFFLLSRSSIENLSIFISIAFDADYNKIDRNLLSYRWIFFNYFAK